MRVKADPLVNLPLHTSLHSVLESDNSVFLPELRNCQHWSITVHFGTAKERTWSAHINSNDRHTQQWKDAANREDNLCQSLKTSCADCSRKRWLTYSLHWLTLCQGLRGAIFSFFGGILCHVTSITTRKYSKSKYGTETSSFSTPILGGFSCRILAVFLAPLTFALNSDTPT